MDQRLSVLQPSCVLIQAFEDLHGNWGPTGKQLKSRKTGWLVRPSNFISKVKDYTEGKRKRRPALADGGMGMTQGWAKLPGQILPSHPI